jgi:hypothetical protein
MSEAPLSVVLAVPSVLQKVGVVIPVKIEVRNVSSAGFWMVGVLDGSEQGYRFPHYRPSIRSDQPVPPPEMEACGNVAPLRLQDFTHLDPNESFDPTVSNSSAAYFPLYTFANFVAPTPGSYQFQLKLSTLSDKEEDWLGMLGYPGESDVLARLKDVPRVELESNVATVIVIAP